MFSVLKSKIRTCTILILVTYPFLTKSLRHICFWTLSISYFYNILDQLNMIIKPVSKHGWVYYYLCKIFMQILMIDYEGKILYVDFLLTIYILSSEVRKCFFCFLIYGVIGSPWRENLWSLWISGSYQSI